RRLVERAGTEGKPALLEAATARLKGHSAVDPARHPTPSDVEAARAADPIARFRAALLAAGDAGEDGLTALEEQARGEADEALAFAASSPHPDVSTLFDHTYATPVANESRRLPADALYR